MPCFRRVGRSGGFTTSSSACRSSETAPDAEPCRAPDPRPILSHTLPRNIRIMTQRILFVTGTRADFGKLEPLAAPRATRASR